MIREIAVTDRYTLSVPGLQWRQSNQCGGFPIA